jgi:hypothetical protein
LPVHLLCIFCASSSHQVSKRSMHETWPRTWFQNV